MWPTAAQSITTTNGVIPTKQVCTLYTSIACNIIHIEILFATHICGSATSTFVGNKMINIEVSNL